MHRGRAHLQCNAAGAGGSRQSTGDLHRVIIGGARQGSRDGSCRAAQRGIPVAKLYDRLGWLEANVVRVARAPKVEHKDTEPRFPRRSAAGLKPSRPQRKRGVSARAPPHACGICTARNAAGTLVTLLPPPPRRVALRGLRVACASKAHTWASACPRGRRFLRRGPTLRRGQPQNGH